MNNFHYDYMKTKYLEKINLCYMNTESFIYDVRTSDIRNHIPIHFYTSAICLLKKKLFL